VDRLAEIRARLDAATPGPWSTYRESGDWGSCHTDGTTTITVYSDRDGGYVSDQQFIAHAPADIAWLLTELSIRESDVKEIYDLRDQVNALWDVVHVLATDDGIAQAQAHYTERLQAQRNARRPHA